MPSTNLSRARSPQEMKLFGLLTLLLTGCAENTEPYCETTSEHRSVVVDNVSREYVITVPASADTALPVVFNFHGSGGCADEYKMAESDLSDLANAQQFILVYPQGVEDAEGFPEWRPTQDSSSSIQDNDFAFVEQIIDDIAAQHSINPEQLYAVGLSNGGMMAYGLACRRSNLFAAIGVMAGVMLTDSCTEPQPTSVIHFHGSADTIVPLEGNQDFPSVASGIDYWVAQNNAVGPARTELNNGGVLREVYAEGAEGSSVTLYSIQNGQHVWFDNPIDGQSPKQILWDFLSQHRLSGRTDGE